MDVDAVIEWALERAIQSTESQSGPPKLAAAMRHAVFPGGARVRPQLCLAVARACDPLSDLSAAMGAAAAIELLHCASLVHDDLPCFDGADIRRGKPSVHVAFNEPIALLTGDALIVSAFSTVSQACKADPTVLGGLILAISDAVGAPYGIVAGQAWESEDEIDLPTYHRSKTGALFVGASVCGALATGADPEPWRALGDRLGEAYQVADDLRDMALDADALGKPAGQDAKFERPNAVDIYGCRGAVNRLHQLVNDAADSIPACAGSDFLRDLVHAQAARLVPADLERAVA